MNTIDFLAICVIIVNVLTICLEVTMKDSQFELCRSTFRKMVRIGILHRNIFERDISNMGIHLSQHHLLMYIAKESEVSSQKLLAEKLCVSPAAIARTLKELESEGYVERSSIEEDSRCNKIIITDKGKKIVSESHKLFKETDMATFEDFTDEDLELFNGYLDKIQKKLLENNIENTCVRETDEKD